MARRRGFFAELNYQAQQAEKRRVQAQRVAAREHARAVRLHEQALRQAERAAQQLARAAAKDKRDAEREAQRLYVAARQAEAEELNSRLAEVDEELNTLLAATLVVDDYVDLDQLRLTPDHPPFFRPDLEVPLPAPALDEPPPRPEYIPPPAPSGLGSVFGKKKYLAAMEEAKARLAEADREWQTDVAALPERHASQLQQHAAEESARVQALEAAKEAYLAECQRRELEVAESNRPLDELKAGLEIGHPQAVTEYVDIVLSNSVYPDVLEVEHDHEFDPVTRELTLTILLAPPESLPQERSFRYAKSTDEIVPSMLPQKALKERYLGAVQQVALRTLHEVFEADREGIVETIALRVGTEAIDPATGRPERLSFLAVGADRDTFVSFELANVVPAATLEHLGASMVRNPLALEGLDEGPGVRGR